MVSCEEAAEMLSAKIDGELDKSEAAILAKHLESCGDCRGLKERFHAVDRLVAGAPPAPGPDLKSRIERSFETAGRLATRRGGPGRLASIAAAALVLIAISMVVIVMSDHASADRVEQKMVVLDAMNTQTLEGQDAVLKTFEWELNAMRIMLSYSSLEGEAEPILERIDTLMSEINRLQQRSDL